MSNVITLESADSDSTASISVDRGFNCFEFKADIDGRIVDVIDSQDGFSDGEVESAGTAFHCCFLFRIESKAAAIRGQARTISFLRTRLVTTATGMRFTVSALIVRGESLLREKTL